MRNAFTSTNATKGKEEEEIDNSFLAKTGRSRVFGIPLGLVGKAAKFIGQGVAQSGAKLTLGIKDIIQGNKTPSSLKLDPQASKFEKGLMKGVFGTEEVTGFAQDVADTELSARGALGLKGKPGKLSGALTAAPLVALTALDFTGFGGGKKEALEQLVKANLPETVMKTLAKMKIPSSEAAKLVDPLVNAKTLDEVKAILGQTDAGKRLINPKYFEIDDTAKTKLTETAESIRPELEAFKGKPLTHEEVLKAAGDSEILRNVRTRAETLASEAQSTRLKQDLAAMAESDGKTLSPEFIRNMQVWIGEGTDIARQLEARKIMAAPELYTNKEFIIKQLLDMKMSVDDIAEAAKGVNFENADEVADFYRKYVKPTLGEIIDEYRYINLLSSPRTHIINAFSNLLQATVLRPGTKLVTGAFDAIGAGLAGKARAAYASEVPAYYRGAFNAVGEASNKAWKAMTGATPMTLPDVKRIPTGNKALKPFQAIPRLLEAGDVFFRTIIRSGELEALAKRAVKQGKTVDEKLLAKLGKEADEVASKYVFRDALDAENKSGQGKFLSAIDKFTGGVYGFRKAPIVKWFVPFVQTPMNILKQGIEYSPAGLLTLPGAANKTEQLAKAFIGSTVFAGAGAMAAQGRTTWAAPKGEKEKKEFYAAGRKPYSIKIGDNWVSYTKLGPLAYPIAMASAVQWYVTENPKAATDSNTKKLFNVIGSIGGFFSDQSYVQGMGNLFESLSGDPTALKNAITNIPTQLVPLVSLQRWVSQIIDPVYRQPGSDIDMKSLLQNIQKNIPFASRGVPAITDPLGRPSRVQHPALRALTPFDVGTSVPKFESRLQKIRRQQRIDAIKKARKEGKATSGSTKMRNAFQ